MSMEGEFARYLDDVYSTAPVAREALTDECEVLVVGARGVVVVAQVVAGGVCRRPVL